MPTLYAMSEIRSSVSTIFGSDGHPQLQQKFAGRLARMFLEQSPQRCGAHVRHLAKFLDAQRLIVVRNHVIGDELDPVVALVFLPDGLGRPHRRRAGLFR